VRDERLLAPFEVFEASETRAGGLDLALRREASLF
jgi:hypothetical protein